MIPILRIIALKKMPYMAHLVFSLKPEAVEGLGTMMTSSTGELKYDPEWCRVIGLEQAAGVLLHESMHLLRRHFRRVEQFRPYNHATWNIAADCEINDDLISSNISLPNDGQYAHNYGLPDGKLAEWYYSQLEKKELQQPRQCGGCCSGDDDDGEGMTMELQIQRTEQARKLEQAINETMVAIGKYPGKVPGGLKKLVNQYNGVLDWRQLLRRAVQASLSGAKGNEDYTFRRMSRRQGLNYGPGNVVIAGLHAPRPKIVVALDTSGSMDGLPLQMALGELELILKHVDVGVYFLTGDAQVEEQKSIRDIGTAKQMVKGFGGTDFRPIFEAATKQKPDLFIYLTDGWGPAPETKPPYSVIWCLTPNGIAPTKWGHQVKIEKD